MKAGVKYLLTYTLQYTCTAEAGGNPGTIHSRNCPRVVRIRRNYIKGALPRSNCTLLLLLWDRSERSWPYIGSHFACKTLNSWENKSVYCAPRSL